MTLMRFDPFRDLDRLTEQAFGRGARAMPMEAFRRGDEFVVALDVPGVDPADVDVTVEHNVVSVRAGRRPLHADGDELVIDERPQGEFSRQLFLGDNLDSTKLSANVDRGVLMITVPVAESSKPRRVEIGHDTAERHTIETGSREPAHA
ncbi:Hsp20/alpha crystallin family protein [Kutzneria buriramensis]|uniref:HSP20 family protein n=1 Tax=Kutzneria buriramensis TaxID=1045776 RepID=A0A3E0HPW8_9PSEU|nr:Hsp20/alpha crystallin family protein [Kutzneria buriramensis]REH48464.1 HSP20 family protein [Kutzneria buriramensis]